MMKQRKTFVTTIGIAVVMVVLTLIGYYYLNQFRNGILQVYARQQDAFVKLVLDQINLHKSEGDKEVITDIIATLDSSNSRYWTLSEDNSILFIKNIQETNRYKGFTPKTYFSTEEGMSFLDDLKLNHVSHTIFEIDGQVYVISGTLFNFGGHEYNLALMTDRDVILEENTFLAADIMIRVVIFGLLLLGLFAFLGMTYVIIGLENEIDQKDAQLSEEKKTVAKLNHRITRHDMFHPRWNLYQESVFDTFIDGFDKRGITDYRICFLKFKTEEKRNAFLEDACVYLDRKVLRFQMDAEPLVIFLLFINYDRDEVRLAFSHFYLSDDEIITNSLAHTREEAMKLYRQGCAMAEGEK